jgi:hypothetical protein
MIVASSWRYLPNSGHDHGRHPKRRYSADSDIERADGHAGIRAWLI